MNLNVNKHTFVKIINTDLYPQSDAFNQGKYPYNLPKENGHRAPNTLKYNNEQFDPTPYCCPGGLYYTTIKHIFNFVEYGNTLCIVTPMENAHIVRIDIKFKTDKLYITHAMKLWDLNTIKFLVENGADIHVNDYILAYAHDYDIFKYLVENGANIHIYSDIYIRNSCSYGYLEILKFVIKQEGGVKFLRKYGGYALQLALNNNQFEIMKYLIQSHIKLSGANLINWPVSDSEYIREDIIYVLIKTNNLDIVKLLCEQFMISYSLTPIIMKRILKYAIEFQNDDIIQYVQSLKPLTSDPHNRYPLRSKSKNQKYLQKYYNSAKTYLKKSTN